MSSESDKVLADAGGCVLAVVGGCLFLLILAFVLSVFTMWTFNYVIPYASNGQWCEINLMQAFCLNILCSILFGKTSYKSKS